MLLIIEIIHGITELNENVTTAFDTYATLKISKESNPSINIEIERPPWAEGPARPRGQEI